MTFSIQQLHSLQWFRYIQAFLLFSIKTLEVVTENHASISVISMTDNSTLTHFNWSFKEKQYILSSYFWGYIILIIPGGYLCQRFGSKVVLSISCLINTIIWLVTPLILRIGGWEAFCIIRATQGISQSVVLAGIFSSLSSLFPKEKVPLIGSLIASGFEVGMIISTAVCGFIIQSSLGWQGIYFIFGGISSVITMLWALFGNDGTTKQLYRREFLSVPWKDILKSPPFLSLVFVIAVQELGIVMTTLEIPIYFQNMFNTDINSNIFFSTIPQITSLLMSWILPLLAHILMTMNVFSLTEMRKLYTIISVIIPVIIYIRLSLLNQSQRLEAESLIVIAASSNGFHDIAYTTNIIDLSPNYVAILSAIMDLCTSLVQLIASLVLSQINVRNTFSTSDLQILLTFHFYSQVRGWNAVFFINASLLPIAGILYILFGTTELQPWNSKEETKAETKAKTIKPSAERTG